MEQVPRIDPLQARPTVDTPLSAHPARDRPPIREAPPDEEALDREPRPPDDGEERRHGLSPRADALSSLLSQLATTARSFLFYDARNDAIHHFLTSLLENFVQQLEANGPIEIAIQPFELFWEGEVVYLNRDRERSLAFRLYRDGVRALTFQPGFHWDELSRLLEILSIRYAGVHQHEDDVVTLLWRANFKHLEVVAVEGFVPDEEDEAEAAPRMAGGAAHAAGKGHLESHLPDNLDLPRPTLGPPVAPAWLELPASRLEALRAEASASALAHDCLALVARLRETLGDPDHRLQYNEVAHLFIEVRDFLLADEDPGPLVGFVGQMQALAEDAPPPWDEMRRAAVRDLLKSSGDHRAVQRMFHALPVETRQLKPALLEVLDRICPDPIEAVIDALAHEPGAAARAVARQVLEHYGAGRGELLRQHFSRAAGYVAVELLRVVARVEGERAAPFIAQQVFHPATEVQDEALELLTGMPYSGAVGRCLFEAFRRADPERQGKLLEHMIQTRDPRFVELLTHHLEEHTASIPLELAVQLGRALGLLGGGASMPRWQAWLKPSGVIRRSLPGPPARQVAAAAALGEIPGEEAAHALRAALVVAGEESYRWIGRALAHHAQLERRGAS